MAWRPVITLCILMLGDSMVIGSPSTAVDGGSDVEMREIRFLLQKHQVQIEALQRENTLLEKKSTILQENVVSLQDKNTALEEKSMTLEGKGMALEEKVLTLEEKVVTLEEKVVTLEEKVVTLEEKVVTLEEKVVTLEEKGMTLEEKVLTLEEKIMTLEQNDPYTDQKENIKAGYNIIIAPHRSSASNSKIRSLPKYEGGAIKKINARVDTTTDSMIAFHAILTHIIPDPATDHIILFDKIVTNIGGHFRPKSGVFTCVEVGVYHFSWMIKVNYNQFMITELVRNGVVIGTGTSGDDAYWTTGSASAITMLAPGDEVWVRVTANHAAGADIYPTFTMFNGFLIH
ncbi:uncharacterized protein LOC117337777 [Pecten maximus]|uniref:uncharacterized protein LOC117337777 n=1 Tax=Pecten maximus TaxID=6579 RepID=UPI001458F384|nr:uncharacterized protein LOC117337777 [Pecten maximus]